MSLISCGYCTKHGGSKRHSPGAYTAVGKQWRLAQNKWTPAKKTEEPLGVELKIQLRMFIEHKDENFW